MLGLLCGIIKIPFRHRTTTGSIHHASTGTNHMTLPLSSSTVASTTTTTTTTTNTNTNTHRTPVLVHQHLYDRHTMHHESYMDRQNGTMMTPPIHLSADFFHPSIASCHKTQPRVVDVAPTEAGNDIPIVTPPITTTTTTTIPDNTPLFINIPSPSVTVSEESSTTVVNTNVMEGGGDRDMSDDLTSLVEIGQVGGTTTRTPISRLQNKTSSMVVSLCNIDVYSLATMVSDTTISKEREELRKHLLSRFMMYQRRLETYLGKGDINAYEECILDIWDEFFPHTAGIHYYDLETPVPRMSHIHQFLTTPCPKAIGTVQCEIERIKITSRGKGVKGRLFPLYEYRLFIRHRPIRSISNATNNNNNNNNGEAPTIGEDGDNNNSNITETNNNNSSGSNANFVRRDTVLMVAKNRGRKHTEHNNNSSGSTSSSSGGIIPFSNTGSKKGSNNYYLYMAQQMDVDDHFRNCNQHLLDSNRYCNNRIEPNGASRYPVMLSDMNNNHYYDRNMVLGRLQSNFIGTEFQIYIPRIQKVPPMDNHMSHNNHMMMSPPFHSDEEIDYDSGMSSDNNNYTTRRSRFIRFRRSAFASHGGTSTATTATATNPPHYSTNSDCGSVATSTTPTLEYRTMKRTLSSPENLSSYRTNTGSMGQPPQRHTRISRRAIANDHNSSPSPQSPSSGVVFEDEAGVITYTANLLGSRPRIMDVCVPKVSSDGTVGLEWKQYVESCSTGDDDNNNNSVDDGCRMLSCFRQIQHRRDNAPPEQAPPQQQPPPPPIGINHNNNHHAPVTVNNGAVEGDGDNGHTNNVSVDNDFGLLALQNRPPWWNAELGSFVLNFGGRVSVASVKNFQLCIRTNPDDIMLQFGRIHGGRHSFTMDYSHPLTAVQAFSIAISSLQSKISFG